MNLSIEGVRELSSALSEPAWVREGRIESFRKALSIPLPENRHTRIKGLSLEKINPEPDGAGIEKGIVDSVTLDGELQSVQVNKNIIRMPDSPYLKEKGVTMTDMNTAVEKYPELFRRYFFELNLKQPPDKFESLLKAFFRGGLLIHVPENVQLEAPLHSSFVLSASGSAMFLPVVVIAERGSRIKLLDDYTSITDSSSPSIIASSVYCFVKESARIEYLSIRNPGENTFTFTTLRSFLERDSRIDWRFGWFGGRMQKGSFTNYLNGEGASSEEVQVFFLKSREHLDISSNLMHHARRTSARVMIKGALRDSARSVFYGNVRIEKGAQEADSFLSDHVLLLNPGARSDSIPGLEIEANQIRASHSASIGQIDEEQIFYLMSRGLDEADARKTIVSGFLSPAIEAIENEEVRQRSWELFNRKWAEG